MGEQMKQWLNSWAWGHSRASEVFRSAKAFRQDGHRDAFVTTFLKGCGREGENAERALKSMLPGGQCETVEVANSSVGTLILPHTMLKWLHVTNSMKAMQVLGAEADGIATWWTSFRSTEDGQRLWEQHPHLRGRTPEEFKFHLPLVLHEDGVPISKHQSAMVRSWASILGSGKERDTRFVISTHIKRSDIVEETEDKSWPMVLQSFDEMSQPVGDGCWGGIVLFVVGDLEWACNDLGLPHYNSNSPCAFCKANTSTMPHSNYHSAAPWRATFRSEAEFQASLRQPLHPLVAAPWFFKDTYRLDLLHLLDHHGVASMVVANVVAMQVCFENLVTPGANQDQRLAFINDDIKAYYSARRVQHRLPPLKMSNVMKCGFPDLHGPAIKAANTRALVPYALALQQRAARIEPTVINRHALKVVESLNEAYTIMYDGEYFLNATDVQKLGQQLQRMGASYQYLACITANEGLTRWKQTPKVHYAVAHLANQARLINPRVVQCYSAEGLVGKVSHIWKKSLDGPHQRISQGKVILKYLTGMALEFA